MTATDELRRMLDERGVEHYDGTETTLWGYEPTSESTGAYRIAADEISGGRMQVRMFNVTPTQAIEATLGCDLQAENAKLRELACDMAHVLTEQYCGSDGHSDCANWDACGLYRKCEERLHACSMWYRMEKLGIEVD